MSTSSGVEIHENKEKHSGVLVIEGITKGIAVATPGGMLLPVPGYQQQLEEFHFVRSFFNSNVPKMDKGSAWEYVNTYATAPIVAY